VPSLQTWLGPQVETQVLPVQVRHWPLGQSLQEIVPLQPSSMVPHWPAAHVVAGAQTHAPLRHVSVDLHVLPQPPQLVLVPRSVQVPPQHAWLLSQALPHARQLVSVLRVVHVSLHSGVPLGH
jgi:hypothetical protein